MKANEITIINYEETIQLTVTSKELYNLDWALIFANKINHSNSVTGKRFKQLRKDIDKIADQVYDASKEMLHQQRENKRPIKWDLCNCGTSFLAPNYKKELIVCRKCGVSKHNKRPDKLHKDYEKTI